MQHVQHLPLTISIRSFVHMMKLSGLGISFPSLCLEPEHVRVISRLVALQATLPGLLVAMGQHYERSVLTYIHDPETRPFLLALARATDDRAAVAGLSALMDSAASLLTGLIDEPAFQCLYREDRYFMVLTELNACHGQYQAQQVQLAA